MKKVIFAFLILIGLFACKEQELPEAMLLDEAALTGTWISGERQQTLSNAMVDENNLTYYVDSTVTEKIDITLQLSAAKAITFTVVKYDENNVPAAPSTVNANWVAGQTTGGEYLGGKKYIVVFDPTKPQQQKTDEWLTTYTVESTTGNQMTLVWTLSNSTARNAKRFKATFTK